MTTKKSLYYRFMAWIARSFIFKKRKVEYAVIPEEGEVAVFVPNHSGAMGPANICLYFDLPFRPWIISYLNDKEVTNNFIFHNFFNGRAKKHKKPWRLLARIVKMLLVPLLQAQNPVWLDHSPKGLMATMKESVATLKAGNNLVIFAESSKGIYSDYISILNEGFVDVARAYYKDTGKSLKFYPVYIPDELDVIKVGTPTAYDCSAVPKDERHRIANYLADEITNIATALPAHKKPVFINEDFNKFYPEYVGNDDEYFRFLNQKYSE